MVTILGAVAKPAQAHSAQAEPLFPRDVIQQTSMWIRTFALSWHSEIPIRIHKSDTDDGGAPEYHNDFASWIERPCGGRAWCSNPNCTVEGGKHRCHDLNCSHGMERFVDARHRTHRAFRKLRRVAPREFDAMYLLCAKSLSMEEVAAAMTDRAIRIHKPERYSPSSVLVLAVSAVDKLSRWF